MPDWEERISRETAPAIRVEHDARYAVAAPLILDSVVWADFGCGTGVSPAAALDGAFSGRAILADLDASAIDEAAAQLSIEDVVKLRADLSSSDDLARLVAAVREGPEGPRIVTCFETIEHLPSFVPAIEALIELTSGDDVTALLSVPNDAHWAIENPYHETAWGEGAFEELRRLLPADHVALRQVPVTGSAVLAGPSETFAPPLQVHDDLVPSHFLVALGPRAGAITGTARAAAVDLDAQRRWERQREAYLAVQQAQLDELRTVAEEHITRVDEFRAYIFELEDKLGIPRSGTPERAAYDAAR